MQYLVTYKRPRPPVMAPDPSPAEQRAAADLDRAVDTLANDIGASAAGPGEAVNGIDFEDFAAVDPPRPPGHGFYPFEAYDLSQDYQGATEHSVATYAVGPLHGDDEVADTIRQLRGEGAIEIRSWQIQPDDFAPDGKPIEPSNGDRFRFDRDRHYGVPGIRVRFPYNKTVLDALKNSIPRGHREFREDDKSWWISARYAPTFRQILADEWGTDFDDGDKAPEVARALRTLDSFGIRATASGDLLILRPEAVREIDGLIRRGQRAHW